MFSRRRKISLPRITCRVLELLQMAMEVEFGLKVRFVEIDIHRVSPDRIKIGGLFCNPDLNSPDPNRSRAIEAEVRLSAERYPNDDHPYWEPSSVCISVGGGHYDASWQDREGFGIVALVVPVTFPWRKDFNVGVGYSPNERWTEPTFPVKS